LTAGIQLATARTPHAALALVVFTLAEGFTATSRDALHLHLTPANLRMHDEGIENATAAKELQSLTERVLDQVRNKSFAWFLEQSTERLIEILAVSIAPGIDAVNNSGEMTTEVAALVRATKLDMADWWEPTADTYLRFVKKPQIIASVSEGVSQEAATEVSKAKTKALMVTLAHAQLAGRRWLPGVMRT
jgi:ParB family chromosome partitioning protein